MSKAGRWWRSYEAECGEWSRSQRSPRLPEAVAIERRTSQRRRMPTVFRMLGAIPWLRRVMERRSQQASGQK